MKHLSNLPKPLPQIVVGTADLGSVFPFASNTDVSRYLDELSDIGATAFDTAAVYQVGGSERALGEWMHSRNNRTRIFLITKGAHPHLLTQQSRISRAAIRSDLHASLKRLRTDSIESSSLGA
jgi:aryl-alcohol dehydrogenase-like predicted oxidoreductase